MLTECTDYTDFPCAPPSISREIQIIRCVPPCPLRFHKYIFHSNRILNFFADTPIKNTVKPTRMRGSFQSIPIPIPLSMMFLTMTVNQRGGRILDTYCRMGGILSIGKMKSDNMIVGSISPMSDINNATCWVSATVEMRIPNERAAKRKSMLSSIRKRVEPTIGTPNTN